MRGEVGAGGEERAAVGGLDRVGGVGHLDLHLVLAGLGIDVRSVQFVVPLGGERVGLPVAPVDDDVQGEVCARDQGGELDPVRGVAGAADVDGEGRIGTRVECGLLGRSGFRGLRGRCGSLRGRRGLCLLWCGGWGVRLGLPVGGGGQGGTDRAISGAVEALGRGCLGDRLGHAGRDRYGIRRLRDARDDAETGRHEGSGHYESVVAHRPPSCGDERRGATVWKVPAKGHGVLARFTP